MSYSHLYPCTTDSHSSNETDFLTATTKHHLDWLSRLLNYRTATHPQGTSITQLLPLHMTQQEHFSYNGTWDFCSKNITFLQKKHLSVLGAQNCLCLLQTKAWLSFRGVQRPQTIHTFFVRRGPGVLKPVFIEHILQICTGNLKALFPGIMATLHRSF